MTDRDLPEHYCSTCGTRIGGSSGWRKPCPFGHVQPEAGEGK